MYKVKLQSFEGPFDLLVYLIETAEMSIYDIQISEITSQYLAFIRAMEESDVLVAEEFMVLAATLIEIKSKMILPRTTIEGDIILEEDPRDALVEKLLEYKRYKAISNMLSDREERNLHIFEKPKEDLSVYFDNPDEYLSLDLAQFAKAFNLFIQKKQKIEQVRRQYTRIERERASMEGRISLILNKMRELRDSKVNFKDTIPNKKDKYDVVVSFISILEMAKERVLNVDQKVSYGDITLTKGERLDDDSILEKYKTVEGLEGGNAVE